MTEAHSPTNFSALPPHPNLSLSGILPLNIVHLIKYNFNQHFRIWKTSLSIFFPSHCPIPSVSKKSNPFSYSLEYSFCRSQVQFQHFFSFFHAIWIPPHLSRHLAVETPMYYLRHYPCSNPLSHVFSLVFPPRLFGGCGRMESLSQVASGDFLPPNLHVMVVNSFFSFTPHPTRESPYFNRLTIPTFFSNSRETRS